MTGAATGFFASKKNATNYCFFFSSQRSGFITPQEA
jgi:hypothetical protein